MINILKGCILFLFLSALSGCGDSSLNPGDYPEYEGPLREVEDVTLFQSKEGDTQAKMVAKKMLEYADGNQEFPEGIYLEFYEEGKVVRTLKANRAYYYKDKKLWKGEEDVLLRNLENDQELASEELFWDPDKEKIYTDKFVTIKLGNEVVTGKIFETNQDFTNYSLENPIATFYLDEE